VWEDGDFSVSVPALTAFGSFDQNSTVTDALVADAFAYRNFMPPSCVPHMSKTGKKTFSIPFPLSGRRSSRDAKASATNASVTVPFWSKLPKAVEARTDTLKEPAKGSAGEQAPGTQRSPILPHPHVACNLPGESPTSHRCW